MKARPDPRVRLIQLIHVAKRELQLDDDIYRAILRRVGNTDSCVAMPISKLEAVLEDLKKGGFQVQPKTSQSRSLADDVQSKKIRSLWLELADAGIVRDRSEKALASYIKRLTGVEALQWLSTRQASTAIESLKQWRKRTEEKHHG